MTKAIVTLNAGSSSIKAAAYPLRQGELETTPIVRVHVSGIGQEEATCTVDRHGERTTEVDLAPDRPDTHDDAWDHIFPAIEEALAESVTEEAVLGVGHRIVHGGTICSQPQALDDETYKALRGLSPLAPNHQPYNLDGVDHARDRWPKAVQIGCFDTAFHRSQPAVAQRFALPRSYEDEGILRYGFHGLSYDYISGAAEEVIGPTARQRVIVCHLGAGASMCAMKEGKSIASTMGFTALDGLPMATRCGQIDPGVLLYLLQDRGLSPDDLAHLLYKESGLKGLSGLTGDMRALESSDAPEAAEAIDYFAYRALREIGALAAALGGLDALIFTAGVGENSASFRKKVLDGLSWLGLACDDERNAAHGPRISAGDAASPAAWVIPTDEELVIARSVKDKLSDD